MPAALDAAGEELLAEVIAAGSPIPSGQLNDLAARVSAVNGEAVPAKMAMKRSFISNWVADHSDGDASVAAAAPAPAPVTNTPGARPPNAPIDRKDVVLAAPLPGRRHTGGLDRGFNALDRAARRRQGAGQPPPAAHVPRRLVPCEPASARRAAGGGGGGAAAGNECFRLGRRRRAFTPLPTARAAARGAVGLSDALAATTASYPRRRCRTSRCASPSSRSRASVTLCSGAASTTGTARRAVRRRAAPTIAPTTVAAAATAARPAAAAAIVLRTPALSQQPSPRTLNGQLAAAMNPVWRRRRAGRRGRRSCSRRYSAYWAARRARSCRRSLRRSRGCGRAAAAGGGVAAVSEYVLDWHNSHGGLVWAAARRGAAPPRRRRLLRVAAPPPPRAPPRSGRRHRAERQRRRRRAAALRVQTSSSGLRRARDAAHRARIRRPSSRATPRPAPRHV